jgi:peptidoglycan/xylan/chitin deacetylase (PgdA/CDA1 family)
LKAIALLYHDVVEPGCSDASGFAGLHAGRYKLERDDFERHLVALRRAVPAPPVTAADVLADASQPGREADPGSRGGAPFLLTFDDGGVSAYTLAAFLLDRCGWKAHFFVTSNFIGTAGFLNASQIRALRQGGHTIGSHSCSHPNRMSALLWSELGEEWKGSVAALEDVLGEKVETASVPGGHYSLAVARAAALNGIRALFTSEPVLRTHDVDGCRVFGRYTIWRGMAPEVSAALASGSGLERQRQYLYWNAKKMAKRVGGRFYTPLVRFLLERRMALERRIALERRSLTR